MYCGCLFSFCCVLPLLDIKTHIYSIAKIDIDNLCLALQLTATIALVSFLSHFNVKVKVISCLQRFGNCKFCFCTICHGNGDFCMPSVCQYSYNKGYVALFIIKFTRIIKLKMFTKVFNMFV